MILPTNHLPSNHIRVMYIDEPDLVLDKAQALTYSLVEGGCRINNCIFAE